ncbi:hypothetical protein FRB99_006773 [Tulasnella sp. 403]|nr:hypothetical protein FRB99_006773 [Tulasnella sp. 403]
MRAALPTHLTEFYPEAYTDFYGTPSGAPCIYKTGPAWPKPDGPDAQSYKRELRAVAGDHLIVEKWPKIRQDIRDYLTSRGINWTSVDAVGFANAGDKGTFCPLLIWLAVLPNTLAFEDAKAAAEHVKDTKLASPALKSPSARPRRPSPLLDLNPLLNPFPNFRKPFTATPGVAIAPSKTPYYEGTGCLFFRLSSDPADKRVVLLTAAHVARPPPKFTNTGMTWKKPSQPREEVVALGHLAYERATDGIAAKIGLLIRGTEVWGESIPRLREIIEDGEDERAVKRLAEAEQGLADVQEKINGLDELHSNVTKHMTNPSRRTMGFVLHTDPINVSDEGFTLDWGFIQLYEDKIDWSPASFKGNKVWVGGANLDFGGLLFPHPQDQAGYKVPQDNLLQVTDVVPMEEIRRPQQLNARGEKALPVIKNGMATATTVGWVNPLESLVRKYSPYEVTRESTEVVIVPYGGRDAFSAKGDSGAAVLARDGRVVAIITGGTGATNATDLTYCTPYCKLELRIKKVFPGSYLYPIVD